MARRLQLHEILCAILGTRKVYFQPPESVKIEYPAIVYKTVDRNDLKADDQRYRHLTCYEVSAIYQDPDSTLPENIMESFLYCRHNTAFTSANLHHDVFTIYY